jgi:hypothetical protein
MSRKRVRKPKKKRGVMSSLRGGFKSAVRGATGVGDELVEAAKKKEPSRFSKIFWNVLTGALLLVAAAVWARRCGIIKH